MAEDETNDDKQFEPTPKKLEDARKKGEIAKSNDLITSAGYGGFLIAAIAFGGPSLLGFGTALRSLLDNATGFASTTFSGSLSPLMGGVTMAVASNILPWLIFPTICAALCVIAQQAVVFAPSKLEPKINKISPISGAKNKFGRQGLFEFAKSAAKLVIYCVILGFFLTNKLDQIISAMYFTPGMVAVTLGEMVIEMMTLVLIVSFVLGGVDFLWQRAEHMRKHRMSHKELMDEMKHSEGDPKLKQHRRQKAVEIALNQMLSDVPDADVIIVNPTHYSVALKWDRKTAMAPILVAKGKGEVAARIREIANENAIPIHSDPPTARMLHANVSIGEQISPDLYGPVAAAIRFAERIRKKAGGF